MYRLRNKDIQVVAVIQKSDEPKAIIHWNCDDTRYELGRNLIQ